MRTGMFCCALLLTVGRYAIAAAGVAVDGTTASLGAHNNDIDAVDRLIKVGRQREREERVRLDADCRKRR